MKKASHLGKDAWPFFLVKVLKPLFIRFPAQGKSLANHSGFVLHFFLVRLFAAGWLSAFVWDSHHWLFWPFGISPPNLAFAGEANRWALHVTTRFKDNHGVFKIMTEYRISGVLRKTESQIAYFLIGVGVLLTAMPFTLLLFKNSKTELWIMFLIPLLVIFGLSLLMLPFSLLWKLRETRVSVSSDGITFYSPGLELQSTWDNIKQIRDMSHPSNLGRYENLVLSKPGIQKCTWWFRLLHRQAESEIPLSMFPGWRSTELGQEIKKYAPHLFDG